jgi:hypothetical protein
MAETNVIVFPKTKKDSPPMSLEEVLNGVETAKRLHIEIMMDEIVGDIIHVLRDNGGFDLTTEDSMKSTAFFIESFRAAIYKSAGLYHIMHEMADEITIDAVEPTTQ